MTELKAPTANKRVRVSGVDRALQILEHLYDTKEACSIYAIAKSIRAPLSTCYSIVDDLVEKDMLSKRSDGSIWLGARLYRYGLAYAHSLDFLTVASHEMHELSRDVGETIQVCAREGDEMIVLAMAEGPGHFRLTSRTGTRLPLNWTASGRLLVGHLSRDARVALFRRCAKASPTGRAVTNAEELADSAAKALRERLEIQIGESDFSVACVASPIVDASGACQATISIVMPERKVLEQQAFYADAVRAAADRIENALGWRRAVRAD